jgi:hypothetical protein
MPYWDVRAGMKKGQRIDFKDYQAAIARKDSKMTHPLLNAYQQLHLSLGYDGVTSYKTVLDSPKHRKMIIDWAEKQYRN